MKKSPIERFNEKVKIDPVSGCHLWTGPLDNGGYGGFGMNGQSFGAHRAAWVLFKGPIPKGEGYHGMCVLHKCDVRNCVNPDHLFLGTQMDNIHDMNAKGRRAPLAGLQKGTKLGPRPIARGTNHWRTRLTDDDIRDIRALEGVISRAEIGKRYGIHKGTVQHIHIRRTWDHVTELTFQSLESMTNLKLKRSS